MILEIGIINYDENTNINVIKKNTINKILKEIAEKNWIKISEGFWCEDSALEERYFKRIIKNAIDMDQKRAILKNMC